MASIFVIILFIIFLVVFIKEMSTKTVSIEMVSVPADWEAFGYSSTVTTERLKDSINEIFRRSRTIKEDQATHLSSFTTQKDEFDVILPGAGISLQTLVYFASDFFSTSDITIRGDIVCNRGFLDPTVAINQIGRTDDCTPQRSHLRLRIDGRETAIINVPSKHLKIKDSYIHFGALEIVEAVHPYTAAIFAWKELENDTRALAIAESILDRAEGDEEWAYNLIGLIHFRAGNIPTALKNYEEAIAETDGFVAARYNRAVALDERSKDEMRALAKRIEDKKAAISELEGLIRDDSNNFEAIMSLGIVYLSYVDILNENHVEPEDSTMLNLVENAVCYAQMARNIDRNHLKATILSAQARAKLEDLAEGSNPALVVQNLATEKARNLFNTEKAC
ncbi:tetratricopeptide repeat protein [Amaricoccus macauensis]|uniref:tetratricopeptide repeat protein n=1 Tax=Amaricoccus macauensis TaxID=57001 RepID=UPI003C79B08F